MRGFILAAVSGAVLSIVPLAASAGDQASVQPAGYDQSKQAVCVYSVHEGMLIRRPDCRSPLAWAAEKERRRDEFRTFQLTSLRLHR